MQLLQDQYRAKKTITRCNIVDACNDDNHLENERTEYEQKKKTSTDYKILVITVMSLKLWQFGKRNRERLQKSTQRLRQWRTQWWKQIYSLWTLIKKLKLVK